MAISAGVQAIIDGIKPISTSFREKVPYQSIVDPNMISGFANEQVNPEAYAQAAQGFRTNLANQYKIGGNRFGGAKQKNQNLLNSYESQRQDNLATFRNQMQGDLASTYGQYEKDYMTDPNAGYLSDFIGKYQGNPQAAQTFARDLGYASNTNGSYQPQGTFRGW